MNADTLWTLAQVILFPILGAVVLYVRQIEVKVITAQSALALAKEHAGAELAQLRTLAAAELAQFKTHVAEKYSTNDYTKEVDTRIAQRLAGMDAKLDRLIERA